MKRNIKKIIYIANARIPTEKAHGIQIMKMCEAFANYGLPRIETTDNHGSNNKNDNHGLDTTDNHGLLYENITYKIRRCVFNVYNELGFGHKESVYQKALEQEFQKEGLKFESQKRLAIHYNGKKVGDYVPDFLVENKVIIEIKSSKFLTKNDKRQIFYYLRGSDFRLALLINFGAPKLQIERLVWFSRQEYQKKQMTTDNHLRKSVVNSPRVSVELIVPWRFNWIKKDPFKYYGIEKNFKIKKLPCIDLIPLDFILGNFALWIQTFSFLIFAKLYLLLKSVAIRGFRSTRISASYDILYTREQFTGLFFKNFILEIHSLPKKIKKIHKKIWKKAKKIIVITNILKKELITFKMSKSKILVAPDGVDISKFDINISKKQARKKLNLPQNQKIILYTGHLYEWKGVQTLAETSKFLPNNVKIYFVGGTKKDVKKFKIKNSKLKLNIADHRPYSEIPYWLKSADVLVLTGTKKSEKSQKHTSPMKMFEYMASGKPIVVSNLPSFREILNKDNSILVEPDSPEALAKGIKKVLGKPDRTKKVSEQAHKDVQKYTWDKRAKLIIDYLKKPGQ